MLVPAARQKDHLQRRQTFAKKGMLKQKTQLASVFFLVALTNEEEHSSSVAFACAGTLQDPAAQFQDA